MNDSFLYPKRHIGQNSIRFLWSRKMDKRSIPLVKWKNLFVMKELGGWGLKNFHFARVVGKEFFEASL